MKKSSNAAVIALSAVAVCMISVVAVLLFKAGSTGGVPNEPYAPEKGTYDYEDYQTESQSSIFSQIFQTTSQVIADETTVQTFSVNPTSSNTAANTTSKNSSTTKKSTASSGSTTVANVTVQGDVTVPVLENVSTAPADSGYAVTPAADLPDDMSFAGLSRSGYNVIGHKKYIFNDDKDPNNMQKNFGYNVLYDAGANLIDFSIDTTRLKFTYGSKDYMIQLWKGQYISGEIGTVGGEIGVYTRPKGTVSAIGHYSCAKEEDWLYMEMTVLWDEFNNGEYLPQFTRNYKEYWWPTGFVDGQLPNRKDSTPLRILGRITFKTEEMAKLFEQAMLKNGFKSVSTFSPEVIDTFKRYEKDVIFLWQDVRGG